MSRLASALATACLLAYSAACVVDGRTTAPAEARLPREAVRSVLDGLQARCIGPANMGGRISDIAVVESNPKIFYVGGGSGGVWKTTDGGKGFLPLFDDQPTQSIGAVALCQGQPDVVYVGTGEANPRNSVSPGCGVFRSRDGGKTWKHRGLSESRHIGRVVVHPNDPDIVYVAALGHCWGSNSERGIYKSSDGGDHWERIEFIDDSTGFIDLCMDPSDPATLYAAAWPVRRDEFSGGSPRYQTGPTGGLFRTTDAGKTWQRMQGGLPEKVGYGRCGLAVSRKEPKVVYAIVQTSETAGQFTNFGQFPTPVGKDGRPGPVGRAETGGVFRSDDRGASWKKVNDLVPRPFYYGQVRVDPTESDTIYVLGVVLHVSKDGGKTFSSLGRTIHADHHALWIDPDNRDHLILGGDGGLYHSTNRGRSFEPQRSLVLCQFYGIAVDHRTPYWVYGGLQDNGTWGGPSATPYADGITQADWKRVLGGDGFQTAVDPAEPDTVFAELQFGGLSRVGMAGPKGPIVRSIRPLASRGEQYRFNWNTPLLLSPWNGRTLYYGGQHLFRSTDRGDSWTRISPDLTAPPRRFAPFPYAHTIHSIAESPRGAGTLWVGTDDGKLWVSPDDGKEWRDVSANIPGVPGTFTVSRIEPSHHIREGAFAALDRHRLDDAKPYVFATNDLGKSWKPVMGDLPSHAFVRVVRQSSRRPTLLFAGTEAGLFVTLDGGAAWHHLDRTGLPRGVRVDDLVIHPRERELVIATHGRGIWIMDIAPLEQLDETVLAAPAHLFDVKPVAISKRASRKETASPGFQGANPPAGIAVSYYLAARTDRVELQLEPLAEKAPRRVSLAMVEGGPGLRTHVFDVEKPGEYRVSLRVGEVRQRKKVLVRSEQ
jgi:photosystem II stability/assembly factor-like uncharacterized protein